MAHHLLGSLTGTLSLLLLPLSKRLSLPLSLGCETGCLALVDPNLSGMDNRASR
ncbi:hypothetical protein LDDCCGHA_5519 [Methylobacterium oxalidis]|nr:hypothetical protein LDDCCGHA_5519 [Methylobacterium oxalidis]